MTLIIRIGTCILNIIYGLFKLCPTKNKVTFISRQSNDPSFEFEMVRDDLLERDPSLLVVFLCHTLDGGIKSTLWDKIKYCFHMLTQMYHIATSKVVILDTYCMVVSLLKHKKSLKVIQMWHSIGTMKKFGYTALDTEEGSSSKLAHAMHMHAGYDYIFGAGEGYKDHLAAGFNYPQEKIITMPLPRVDLLVNDKAYETSVRERIFKAYPSLREKPVILYCPTFRKNDESEFAEAIRKLIKAVDREKFNLVIKLHPLSSLSHEEGVIYADEFSSFEMIFAADYIISDYSCIIYEAALRDVPLYFYNFDMYLYTEGRGLALDYEKELPGPISGEPLELVKAIEEDLKDHIYDREALRQFAVKYVEPTAHATKDIGDFIAQFL